MDYPLSKYRFYHYVGKDDGGKNTICAVSTYAGRDVKGYAKCHPDDAFDEEKGMELAAARCNARIAEKRVERAERKVQEALDRLAEAQEFLEDMNIYRQDAINAHVSAMENVAKLINE